MTTTLSIFGGLAAALTVTMAFSPYLCRLLAWLLLAYANGVQSGREMFRAELDRLHGPVVGDSAARAAEGRE